MQQHSRPYYADENDSYEYEMQNTIREAQQLQQTYNQMGGLLNEAELILVNSGETKFQNLKANIDSHFTHWYNIAASFQKHCNTLFDKQHSLEDELSERDKIISTLKNDKSKDRHESEQHLSVLENVIANSNSQSAVAAKLQLDEQLHMNQRQSIQLHKLESEVGIMNSGANELQVQSIALTEQLAKKDDELLKLRWTIEDLQTDRTKLELELSKFKKEPSFTSANEGNYDMDFSKFIDENDDPPMDIGGADNANTAIPSDLTSQITDAVRHTISNELKQLSNLEKPAAVAGDVVTAEETEQSAKLVEEIMSLAMETRREVRQLSRQFTDIQDEAQLQRELEAQREQEIASRSAAAEKLGQATAKMEDSQAKSLEGFQQLMSVINDLRTNMTQLTSQLQISKQENDGTAHKLEQLREENYRLKETIKEMEQTMFGMAESKRNTLKNLNDQMNILRRALANMRMQQK